MIVTKKGSLYDKRDVKIVNVKLSSQIMKDVSPKFEMYIRELCKLT